MSDMLPASVRKVLEGYGVDDLTLTVKTGNTSLGSDTISAIDVTGLKLYSPISGAGVPAGTIIAWIGTTTVGISELATASGTGVTLTISSYACLSDEMLTRARDEMVLPFVEDKAGFSLTLGIQRVTEFHSGTGTTLLILNRRPITQIHSINLVTNPSNWVYVSPTSVEVVATEGILKLKAVLESWQSYVPAFPRGKDNIKVDYSYGFASAPVDLVRAVNNLVASYALGQMGARTGGGSVGGLGLSRTYGPRGKYGDIRVELERWAAVAIRRYVAGLIGG